MRTPEFTHLLCYKTVLLIPMLRVGQTLKSVEPLERLPALQIDALEVPTRAEAEKYVEENKHLFEDYDHVWYFGRANELNEGEIERSDFRFISLTE